MPRTQNNHLALLPSYTLRRGHERNRRCAEQSGRSLAVSCAATEKLPRSDVSHCCGASGNMTKWRRSVVSCLKRVEELSGWNIRKHWRVSTISLCCCVTSEGDVPLMYVFKEFRTDLGLSLEMIWTVDLWFCPSRVVSIFHPRLGQTVSPVVVG